MAKVYKDGHHPLKPEYVSDNARQVIETLQNAGFCAYIVGGGVRDIILEHAPKDFDIATDAKPEDVRSVFKNSRIIGRRFRIVHVYFKRDIIEVSTFRANHNGNNSEHAETRNGIITRDNVFGTIDEDAERRDFTINAIYLDAEGQVFDPLNGQADLAARRLRFVGTAADRMQEDALRMLHYCRFSIEYSDGQHDSDTIDALTSFAPLATRLSGERVAQELRKILSHEGYAPALDLLHQTGLDKTSLGCDLVVTAMPSNPQDLRLVTADFGWLVVLAAIIPQADVTMVLARLRLSRANQKFCAELAGSHPAQMFADLSASSWPQSAYFMDGGAAAFYACAAWRIGADLDRQHYRVLHQWQPPKLPVSGADLLSHGVDNGLPVGHMLKSAETLWVQSDFTLTKPALLAAVVKLSE